MRRLFLALICLLPILFCFPALAEEEEEQQFPETYVSGDWVYYLNGDGTAVLSTYTGPSGTRTLTVPSEVDGHPVTVIDSSCINFLPELRELAVPEGVEELGEYALASLDQLGSVSLPSTLRSIGATCFLNDFQLEEINVPSGVTAIGEGAFGGCPLSRLDISPDHPVIEMVDGMMVDRRTRTLLWFPPSRSGEFTVPDGIPRIGSWAFCNSQLTCLTIPDSVTALSQSSISCPHLTTLELGAGITELTGCIALLQSLKEFRVSPDNPALEVADGVLFLKEPRTLISYPPMRGGDRYSIPEGTEIVSSDAFSFCRLKTIECPSSLRELQQNAITWCDRLTGIRLNEGLESMRGSIQQCNALTEITLPDSLRDVGVNPAHSCSSLKAIKVSKDHPYLCVMDNALVQKDGMVLLCYPAGLNTKKYTIPEGVRELAFGAFAGCGKLETVILPEGVETINGIAFTNCRNLKTIVLPRSLQNISPQAFLGLGKFQLTVPAGSYAEEYAGMYHVPYRAG